MKLHLRSAIFTITALTATLLPAPAHAQRVLDVITSGLTSVDVRDKIAFDGMLFLSTSNFDGTATSGIELWKSDGTNAGTVRVADIRPGSDSSIPAGFTLLGSDLIFAADDGTHGRELWKTDGTEGGTEMVKDVRAISSASSFPDHLTAMGGNVYFSASGYDEGPPIQDLGNELWKSDGTEAGTVLVKDIQLGNGGSFPDQLTAVGNRLFFQADDGVTGEELWVTDGTEEGTMKLSNFNRVGFSSVVTDLTRVGETLFFTASGADGKELYKSTGTDVSLVEDLSPGAAGTIFQSLTDVDGTLFFVARIDNNIALWTSDGTEAGTEILLDLTPASALDQYTTPLNVNGTFYFTAEDGTTGRAMWKSDGTPGGTMKVSDVEPALNAGVGFFGGGGGGGATTDEGFIFTGFLAGIGTEMFKTDGTPEGTGLYRDLGPGFASAVPTNYLNVGNQIFFTATIDFLTNLWVTDVPVGCETRAVESDGAYDFGPDAAVDIVFSGLGGSCSVLAERFERPPPEPTGIAEVVIGDYYWSIGAPTCTFDAGTEIRFNLDELPAGSGFADPSAIKVYKRSGDEDDFTEVTTVTYDAATNEIVVTGLTGFSEFAFAGDMGVGVDEIARFESPAIIGAPYPNPSASTVQFDITVAEAQQVRVAVYDMLGRRVATVPARELQAGELHSVSTPVTNLASGAYIIKVDGERFVDVRMVSVSR